MIKLKKVSKIYFDQKTKKKKIALDQISLNLPNKGIIFIYGKSGSGKTTLFKIISGLEKISYGELYVNNILISNFQQKKIDDYRNGMIAFSFQDNNLIEHLTVYDNIILGAELQGKKIEETFINSLFKEFDLDIELKNTKVEQLSGGQKQRIGIIRALLKDSDIVLADEPTSNLDEKSSQKILNKFKEISKEKLVIIISHNLLNAYEYSDRIIEIENSCIKKDITKKELSNIEQKEINDKIKKSIQENIDNNFYELYLKLNENLFEETKEKKDYTDTNYFKKIKLKPSNLKFRSICKIISRSFWRKRKLNSLFVFIILFFVLFPYSQFAINIKTYAFYQKKFFLQTLLEKIASSLKTQNMDSTFVMKSLKLFYTCLILNSFFIVLSNNKEEEIKTIQYMGGNIFTIIKIFLIESLFFSIFISIVHILFILFYCSIALPIFYYQNTEEIKFFNYLTSYFPLEKYLIKYKYFINKENLSEHQIWLESIGPKILFVLQKYKNQQINSIFEVNDFFNNLELSSCSLFQTIKNIWSYNNADFIINFFSLKPLYRIINLIISIFMCLFLILFLANLITFFLSRIKKKNHKLN
ncbi:ATP-binding cassette domain-containing protein ['Cynodon dactylon' phytoplasma]|uniref:ATP-binding cassette domain-containing protein n=1 Tax='Cynodon dactylon' phytoplasma TaxID=295320 RepID=UPI001265B920|nr:ATP-binding cassette domain-containing protein ['Cynodon dactylon' phytoplasma]KAB8122016.1 ATP-binding cassette domain-containing protein ['Cynodon dactylon' phytoplasma]